LTNNKKKEVASLKKKATLTQLRELRNMTQEELAFKAGITSRTLISYENDVMKLRKASYERLKRIADALDVSVDDIFLDDISVFLKLPYISRLKHLTT
jgi:transcriptional regulator with XRE-family HTH domain